MIEAVFFDIEGVLGSYHAEIVQDLLRQEGKIPEKRDKELDKGKTPLSKLMLERRALVGSPGTLDQLIATDYRDPQATAADVARQLRKIEQYGGAWDIARKLRNKCLVVGIISDQIAESARYFRDETGITDVFDPVYFSAEIGSTQETGEVFSLAQRTVNKEADRFLMVAKYGSDLGRITCYGWKALHFYNAPSLRKDLKKLGLEV